VFDIEFFNNLRFRNSIENKKRKHPKGKVLIPIAKQVGIVNIDKTNDIEIILEKEAFDLIQSGKIKQIYLPIETDIPKSNQHLSRLLAKIGYEMLALRLIENEESHELFVQESQFDPIREYVRINKKNENWVYHSRKIYEEDENFFLQNGKAVDMIFECDFLVTKDFEIYFVLAIKGFEFVTNLAGSSIDGFNDWLKDNDNISPLYIKGKHFGYNLTPNFLIDK